MLPKVTSIIPLYNVENYVEKCLQSIINQTLKDIEIIIIDDASTDNSLKIAKSFAIKDNRIRIIEKKTNQGVSVARNLGIVKSIGKYIHFMDSDDWLDLSAYELLYNEANDNSSDLVIFPYYVVKNNQKHLKISKKLIKGSKSIFISDSDKILLLKSKPGITVWNKFYKSSFITKSKLFFINNLLYEDIPWTMQSIIEANKVSYYKMPLYFYNKRENSIMSSGNDEDKFDIVKSIDITYKYLKDKGYLNIYGSFFVNKAIKTYSSYMKQINKNFKYKFYLKMKQSLNKFKLPKHTPFLIQLKLFFLQKIKFILLKLISSIK